MWALCCGCGHVPLCASVAYDVLRLIVIHAHAALVFIARLTTCRCASITGKQICNEINKYRRSAGRSQLEWNDEMHKIAYEHAKLSWKHHREPGPHWGGGIEQRRENLTGLTNGALNLTSENMRDGSQYKFDDGAIEVARFCVDIGKKHRGWTTTTVVSRVCSFVRCLRPCGVHCLQTCAGPPRTAV